MFMGEVDIVISSIYLFLLVALTEFIMVIKEVISVAMMEHVDIGLKRQATITFTIQDKVFNIMEEVDIGLRTAYIPPIIKVGLSYCLVYLFTKITEVDICLRRATLLHINMVDYTCSTQGPLKIIFQGVRKEKTFKKVIKDASYIPIKISFIIIIQEFQHALIQACHHNLI